MRVLRKIAGVSSLDHVRKEVIREQLDQVGIVDKVCRKRET